MPVRFDAEELIAQVNAQAATHLRGLGVAEHGETGGAVYVAWPDGHRSVLTRSRTAPVELQRTAEVLDFARGQGLPLPRYELILQLPDCTAVVQECLPGTTTGRPTPAQLDAMLALNERFADVLIGRPDVPIPDLHLHDPHWHAPLHQYSRRTRDVLREIQNLDEVGMTGHDLVHMDFTPENFLFGPDGDITGVVDWDGAARGDRRFALIKLRFELAWGSLYPPAPDPALICRLDRYLAGILDPATLRRYWAHWSLRMLGWTIGNFPPADIDLHIDLALAGLR